MKRILAIDDDIYRYEHFQRMLEPHNIKVDIVCCSECIKKYITTASAILLDYDLDNGELCECENLPDKAKSIHHVDLISQYNLPVIISSASWIENRIALSDALKKRNIIHTRISANDTQPELLWVGWLFVNGVFQ